MVQWTQLPFIGKDIARIGQVQQILATPCSVDPAIYVEALFQAAPYAIWSLVKPSGTDSISFGREGGMHHRYYKRRRGYDLRERFRFNGELLGGRNVPLGRGSIGAAFIVPFELAQKFGWYLLIADATTNGILNWVSTAYQWSGCKTPGQPRGSGVIANGGYNVGPSGSETIGFFDILDQSEKITMNPAFIHVQKGIIPTMYFTVSCHAAPGFTGSTIAGVRVVNLDDGRVYKDAPMQPMDGGGQTTTGIAYGPSGVAPGGLFALVAYGIQGYCTMKGTRFGAQGVSESFSLLPDP